jgi:hypothetical protein
MILKNFGMDLRVFERCVPLSLVKKGIAIFHH